MTRKVFFSFHYERDAWRAANVRNSDMIPNDDEYGVIENYETHSLVNNAKSILIFGLMACLALLTIFASPEHYTLRFLTIGSLLAIASSLFSSQFITEKIEEFALMLSIEVADGLVGQDISKSDRNLPLELRNLYKVALEERVTPA